MIRTTKLGGGVRRTVKEVSFLILHFSILTLIAWQFLFLIVMEIFRVMIPVSRIPLDNFAGPPAIGKPCDMSGSADLLLFGLINSLRSTPELIRMYVFIQRFYQRLDLSIAFCAETNLCYYHHYQSVPIAKIPLTFSLFHLPLSVIALDRSSKRYLASA